MANSITVTLHIDESDFSKSSVTYSPDKQVMVGDEVVFRVEGTTELIDVQFQNASPFSDSSFTLGGQTLTAPPKTVSPSASVGDYGFIYFPASGTSRRPPKPDQPGTTSGDIEVVPERGGGWEPRPPKGR